MATPVQPVPVLVNRARNGKLNSDTDILELKEGNYPDRVNVEFNADGELFSDTPALGNRLVCDIGVQEVQQQQTRIYIDVNAFFNTIAIQFYNKNGQLIQTVNGTASSQSLQGMKDTIMSAFESLNWYSVFYENQFSTEPYIDVTINCAYSDYTLVLTDNNGNVLINDDIKEAISLTGQGNYIEIGSKDLLGTTWIFSTTQDQEQSMISSKFMTMYRNPAVYGGQVIIYFPSHGLIEGETIVVANATGVGATVNGQWVVNYIDDNNFGLFLSIGTPFATTATSFGGVIYKNIYGLGQIGVQQYVGETDSYTYTRILASKRFNFRTMYQIDVDAVLNNNGYLLKFTDNYNYPRTFSYRGAFMEDGALQPINPDGYYTYETLTDEIKNIINYSAAVVTFDSQVQAGGTIPPANWRYAVRFYTDTNATTEVSLLSNPIPAYPPIYTTDGQPKIYGAAIGILSTPKINRLLITGITPGVFKYIELIGYNYPSSSVNSVAVNSFNIRKELLSPDQSEIILEHNGNEPDITFNDTTLSIAVRPDIIRAGSNRFCENRLVYGNITTSTAIDIRDWALTIKYSIKRKEIRRAYYNEMKYEFYDYENTNTSVGYQPYEWYRIYISAETYSGNITDSVFSFDVRFVTIEDYQDNIGYQFLDINGSDRRDITGDEFVDYSLGYINTGGVGYLYQLYLELNSIDWEFQINGVKVRDIFKSIKVSRAERVKEVIVSGAISMPAPNVQYGSGPGNFVTGFGDNVFQSVSEDFNTPLTSGLAINYKNGFSLPLAGLNNTLTISPVPDNDNKRQYCSFYAPDITFGAQRYDFIPGDKLLNFGSLEEDATLSYHAGAVVYTIYNLNSLRLLKLSLTTVKKPQSILIKEATNIDAGGTGTLGTITYHKTYPPQQTYVPTAPTDYIKPALTWSSPVLFLDNYAVNVSNHKDTGLYYGLIFREKSQKYGDRNSFGNTVVFTGTTIYKDQVAADVFGGDVFCQQLQFRQAVPTIENFNGYAFTIPSHNIVNVNLRQYDPSNPVGQLVFPQSTTNFAIWITRDYYDTYLKNYGYSITNQVQASTVFDPEGNNLGNYITRKYYSQLNPNNANTDKYREFLPLDFQDNPNNFGPITHLEIVNGELFTLQQRGFTREFFNATGRLQSAEDGDVLIGDGSVLSRKGLRLTMLGTNQKWSVCKGFTSSGKETIIWINDEFGCVVRFGADGTVNISEREMMSVFFRERMRFVIGKDTPADNQGISTVWDNIGKNFIITQRAWKDSPEWITENDYFVGNSVILNQTLGVPQIYVCLADNTSEEDNTPGTSGGAAYWEAISLEDLDYYNTYTIVFNEQKNSFTHRYTFYPKIYHTQNNRYFSPSPYIIESNNIYRHRDKDVQEITFYGRENVGYTEYIINYMSRTVKKFIAHAQTALLKPKRVEFETQFISENGIDNRKTYLDREDFTMRENQAFSPIKNNLDSQGRNDQTTAPMTGLWLKIRTFFAANEKQKINDTTVVIRTGQRNVENP